MLIHNLIAAINPDAFCERSSRRQVKQVLHESKTPGERANYLGAAAMAIPVEPNHIAVEQIELENPFRLPGFKSPTERHVLSYDSFDESIEAYYFWLLDELNTAGWTVSKLTDTFAATPASGLHSDLTRREGQAQREALKLLREAHQLIRDILRMSPLLKQGVTEFGDEANHHLELGLLRSKIESLKLYAHWLGPYLRQARQLKQGNLGGPALINLFNTATAQITLLAQKEYPVHEDVDRGELPRMFLRTKRRAFYSVLVIELGIRAAPERTSPGAYNYRGRFELTLTSYALNADELVLLRRELDRDDLNQVIQSVGEASAQTLTELTQAIEGLIPKPKLSEPAATDPNPFLALFDFSDWFGVGEVGDTSKEVLSLRTDSDIETVIRSQALLDARRRCLEFYTRCKQALRMSSF